MPLPADHISNHVLCEVRIFRLNPAQGPQYAAQHIVVDNIAFERTSHECRMHAAGLCNHVATGMRGKGFVSEHVDPNDRRRRIFRLADDYLNQGDDDIQRFLDWCAKPENRLC